MLPAVLGVRPREPVMELQVRSGELVTTLCRHEEWQRAGRARHDALREFLSGGFFRAEI
jgi:hypothetical protein